MINKMRNKQIIIILCMLWIGGSMANSFRPTSFDYDYREDSRKSSNNYIGKSAATTPRPSLQTFWNSIVSNIPTLPPFRWNVTNSFSNLFNGAQQIVETPVVLHDKMEEEPNRRRKSSKRKLLTKKNKNRRRAQPLVHSNYYHYHTPSYHQNEGYQQIQLQPIGVDEQNIMHFYEPITGIYYAMHMVAAPPNYFNHNTNNNYYSNHEDHTYNSDDNDGDNAYHHDKGYGDEEYNTDDSDTENMANENKYNNDAEHDSESESEHEIEEDENYAVDEVLTDNLDYTDDEGFEERKFKVSLNAIKPLTESDIARNIVKIQKQLLQPEFNNDQKTNVSRFKPTAIRETTDEKEEELVRNVLGSFMKDDLINRRRQSANPKQYSRLVEKPRQKKKNITFFRLISG